MRGDSDPNGSSELVQRGIPEPGASEPSSSSLAVLPGRLLFNLGVIGCLLLLAAQADGLPPGWQRSIRANAPVWGMGTASCLVLGVLGMWAQAHSLVRWAPTIPGRRFKTVILYTRTECPLCEESARILAKYRAWLPEVIEVDVDDDQDLVEEFGEWVPVVAIDDRVRFKGMVNEFLLRRLIEGTNPAPRLRAR